MKITPFLYAFAVLSIGLLSCKTEQSSAKKAYPSIFLVENKTEGFTSLEDLKNIDKNNHQGILWNDFIKQSEKDFEVPYLDPTIDFPGRSPVHLKHKNVSYDMALGVCDRLFRSSLLFVLTEDQKYKDLVMRQIEALYDTTLWPMWCDQAHTGSGEPFVDIRTYRISMWVALAYNWLHDYLTEKERAFIIEGLDQRAIQPFWEKLAQKPGWYLHRHNWFTNMFGGMAITAMAIGDAHPETQRLLDTIVPEMIDFNKTFGEMGEFNEPPGYAGAVRFSVQFAEAYRYYTKNARNLLNEKPFPEVCYWILHHTLPPGRLTAFGDTPPTKTFSSPEVMAAAANANQDGILQWYYLENFKEMTSPYELLWYNPNLKPESPAGKLPLGIGFKEHGTDFISRTSWDPKSTACIVYGKAGRETNHDDNDVGQVLIDGFGERLIIDSGKPEPIYPKDYFSKTQYNYYTRSSKGHNVLVIGKKEMISEPNELARGKTLQSWFDDDLGSYWEMDLSPVYSNADKVTRKVMHLHPGIVLVHDYAELPKEDSITLRWHTFTTPELTNSGDFWAMNKKVALIGRTLSLDNNELNFSMAQHEFKSPYDLTRQGDPLVQNYEPFVKVSTYGKSCSMLTLFAVMENKGEFPLWESVDSGWKISIEGEEYLVKHKESSFEITSESGGRRIQLN